MTTISIAQAFPIWSNLIYLISVILLVVKGRTRYIWEAVILTLMMLFSMCYHGCQSTLQVDCILPVDNLTLLDALFAMMAFSANVSIWFTFESARHCYHLTSLTVTALILLIQPYSYSTMIALPSLWHIGTFIYLRRNVLCTCEPLLHTQPTHLNPNVVRVMILIQLYLVVAAVILFWFSWDVDHELDRDQVAWVHGGPWHIAIGIAMILNFSALPPYHTKTVN